MTAILGELNELRLWPGGLSPSFNSFILNGSTDQWETVFQAPEDITITRGSFRQGAVTGTSPTFKLSLQGVDGSGFPDGTIKGGGSPVSMTWQPTSGGNNTWQWKNFSNSYACSRGEMLALVIAYDSGTIDGSNNCQFALTAGHGTTPGIPYTISNDAGSRTKQASTGAFGYGSSGTAYGSPILTAINSTFNSGSTPDEKSNLINIPTTWWSTYKIVGAVLYCTLAAGTSFDLVLYEGITALQSINIDADHDQAPTTARQRSIFFDESTLSTLSSGTGYRLAFKPGANNLSLAGLTVNATADMDAYLGGASVCQASTRSDAGSWADDNTTRFGINPIIADITAPSSGIFNIFGGCGIIR